jgi:hypothetical protein
MKQYQDLNLKPNSNSSLHYISRLPRPSSGTLNFGGTAEPSALLRRCFRVYNMFKWSQCSSTFYAHVLPFWHVCCLSSVQCVIGSCRIRKRSLMGLQPITLAARSKAWTVFARTNTGIVGSNPTLCMDVCLRLFCDYVVLCIVAALRRADPPSKLSYRLCKRSRNWKSWQGPTKGCRAINR